MKANTLITTSFHSSIPYHTQRWTSVFWHKYIKKEKRPKNRWHLRWDAVDTHSSVNPFSAQSLSQFDHSSFRCVVGELLLGMGDCRVEEWKSVTVNGQSTTIHRNNFYCIIDNGMYFRNSQVNIQTSSFFTCEKKRMTIATYLKGSEEPIPFILQPMQFLVDTT